MKVYYLEDNTHNYLLFMCKEICVIMKDSYTGILDEQNFPISQDYLYEIGIDLDACVVGEMETVDLYNRAPFASNIERVDIHDAENMIKSAKYSKKIYEITDWFEDEQDTGKTSLQWLDEASSFAYEFEKEVGRKPTLEDVIEEAKTIDDIEDADAYGAELFKYISEVE